MTLEMIFSTLFEIFLFLTVVWGIFNEDKLIRFEQGLIAKFRRRKLKVVRIAKIKNISTDFN